jgi:hypothetical protein
MKNLVPPIALSNPKVTAICIQSLRFSGTFCAIIPDISKGIPKSDGKKDVTELDSDTTDTTIPHPIKNVPSPIVILGIDWPATENSSLMTPALSDPLKFLGEMIRLLSKFQ